MSTVLSADAKAVVRAAEALTTQVRRIADALQTPVDAPDDAPTTPATRVPCPYCVDPTMIPTTLITDHIVRLHNVGLATYRPYPGDPGAVKVGPTLPRPAEVIEDERALREYEAAALHRHGLISDSELNAVLATSDTQRTTRLASIRNLLDRAGRGVLIGGTEGELLRQQVEAELRLSDQLRAGRATWKGKAEQMERARDEEERLRLALAAERDRWKERAEEAQAVIERVRAMATTQRARGESGSTDHKIGLYDAAVAILADLDGTEQQPDDEALHAKLDEATATLRRIRALHARTTVQTTSGPADACSSCELDSMSHPWPCPTAEALAGPRPDGTEQPTT